MLKFEITMPHMNDPSSTSQSHPTVSIVTAAYNSGHFLSQAIQSVFQQTFSDWEMIIVDDGSTDNTLEVAHSIAQRNPRVRVYSLPSNHGRPALARRKAIKEASGRFLAFLDSDDFWLPTKLQKQLAFMEETGAAISYTQYRKVSVDGAYLGDIVPIPQSLTYNQLLKHNAIACLTAVVDTEKTGPIDHVDGWRDDFLLWLKITKMGFTAYGLEEDLARYRVGQASISKNKWRAAYRTWRMYRDSVGLSVPSALYNFCHYAVLASRKHGLI